MGMKIFLGLLVCFLVSSVSYSQEIGEEVRNDTTFKVHIVEQGNTLYGLKQKYNTTIEAIIKANSGVENGIQVGQKLYIPIAFNKKSKSSSKKHIVEQSETLFGISRKYDLTVEDLIDANPGIEDGLKIGQELIIPPKDSIKVEDVDVNIIPEDTIKKDSISISYEVKFDDSIVKYTVQRKETLYSISRRFMVSVEELSEVNEIKNNKIKPGQELIIPLKKERIERVEIRNIHRQDTTIKDSLQFKELEVKEKYKVVLLLPFKIESNTKVLAGMLEENTRLNNVSDIALDFLMGAEMALDSLKKMGLTAEVIVYDTKGDEKVVISLIEDGSLANTDLIIGPFYPNLVEVVSGWCKDNNVELIVPMSVPTKVLMDNPYVTTIVPSDITMINAMANYMAQHHADDKIFIMKGESQSVQDRVEIFRKTFASSLPEEFKSKELIVINSLGSSSGIDMARKVDLDTANFFICLSDDVKQVMEFVNTLNAAKNYSSGLKKADITLVGTKEWMEMNSLNNYYKNRVDFHFANSSYLNFKDSTTNEFIKEYRSLYEADPTKFSIHGFDVVLSQGARVLLKKERNDGLMNYFMINRIGESHGKENNGVFICKQSEFEIELLHINKKELYFETNQVGDN
jgi:LysM repeat protein